MAIALTDRILFGSARPALDNGAAGAVGH